MFTLRLLGSASLDGPDGPVAGRAALRQRVALLALLAVEHPRPLTRDKLLAYLWPESGTDEARHLLRDSLYILRSALGDDSLVATGNDLRLNPDRLICDLWEFDAALGRNALGPAVELYRGPFLDGFHLSDAAEFERWTEGVRARLAYRYLQTLEQLAEQDAQSGNAVGAVERWLLLTREGPYNSRIALRYMQALERAGDRAGALRHASLHSELLRSELGAVPDAEVVAYAERLRFESRAVVSTPPDPPRPRQVPTGPDGYPIEAAAAVLPDLAPAPSSGAAAPQPRAIAGRRLRLLASITILLAALAGAVVWPRWHDPQPLSAGTAGAGGEPSIAVLPLTNLSPDPRDAALAVGMTEALIDILATAGDLRVIASTSASAFKTRDTDARLIADSLKVSNLLQGTMEKIGPRLRVVVRLVDGRDGSTRWSQTYDREFTEVFSLQDDIARSVAAELDLRLDKDKQLRWHHTRNPEAYALYLRGSDPILLRTESGVWKALEYFQQAIAIDSSYAAAYAGLALANVRRARTSTDPGMPLPELLALADKAARKAVALDDSLPEAHYALGRVREAVLDFPAAESEIKRAITLDPTRSIYYRALGYLHEWTGNAGDELADSRRALETDPLNPYAVVQVAGALFTNGRYDEALAQLHRVAVIQPPLQGAVFVAAQCYVKKQMWAEAIAALRSQAGAGEPTFTAFLGYALARTGQRDEAKRILGALLARRERARAGAFPIAVVYVGLGDFDQAFAWLDRSIDDRSISSGILGPVFEDLQQDSRFEHLRRRLGLHKG